MPTNEEGNKFTIETYDCSDEQFDFSIIKFKYHCVYILENGKDAYIGETKNPIRRGMEHDRISPKNNKKQYHFTRIHVITGLDAEETPAKHYENLLIKLMKVDRKFNIINGNDGERQHYFRKNQFELQFDELWPQLEKKALVRMKEFKLIVNSSAYKYSPHTVLTDEQYRTLTNIVKTIDSEETRPHHKGFKARPILVSGDAGTGKTVVATSLFYYLKSSERHKDKKIALLYANTAIRKEIQTIFKNTDGLSKNDVISPVEVTKQHYDIIICDESQRLRRGKNLGMYYTHFKKGNERLGFNNTYDELDWILANSDCQVLFYDPKQITSPSDVTYVSFEQRLKEEENRGIRPVKLNEQMRIKAGDGYVPYIFDVLHQKAKEMKAFENYEFKLFNSFADLVKRLDEKENDVGLCRLGTGYAWEWKGREDKTLIKVNKDQFFDGKVKQGASDEELKEYILNTYAVLLTRGIRGTYVYVCDRNLREYLEKYIVCEKQ